jgi:ABC-type cobalamin transport system permease subunit
MINGLQAFARAVGWGTLMGAAPYTVLFIIPLVGIGMGEGSIANIAILLFFPFLLSGALVLGSAVVFGLPLTVILSRIEREQSSTYALAGLILGALVPAVIVVCMTGEIGGELLFLAVPGAFAGIATGASWGRWREALNR